MAEGPNQKPWKVEYAKSSLSTSYRTCENNIEKENLRFGKMVQIEKYGGFMPMWNHANCIMKKANQITSTGDIEGFVSLLQEDQKKIVNYICSGGPAEASASTAEDTIGISQSSRATCILCRKRIEMGKVRISMKRIGEWDRGMALYDAECFMASYPSTEVDKFCGWENLPASAQEALSSSAKDGKKSWH